MQEGGWVKGVVRGARERARVGVGEVEGVVGVMVDSNMSVGLV